MRRETFERLKKLGVDNLDDIEEFSVRPLEDLRGKNGEEQKQEVLSIKYLSSSIDEKNINLTFEISAKNLKTGNATIYVQEMNAINEDAVPLTNIVISPNGKKNIRVSFPKDKKFDNYFWQDGFSYQATISCDKHSAETNEFKLKIVKKIEDDGCNLKEPTIVKETMPDFTEEQKAKIITIVYGESAGDANLMTNIPWIYFNLTKNQGFENGLKKSSFYTNPSNNKYVAESYRICMYYLGQGNQYKDYKIVNGLTVEEYCAGNDFIKMYKFDLDTIKSYFDDYILITEPENPYFGWEGQGYWGDMDFREKGPKKKWAMASQYFHLQNKCKVKNILVKEFIAYDRSAKDVTTYLCNDKAIEKYFKENPKDLPEYELSDYKTIPRVHIPKNKSKN